MKEVEHWPLPTGNQAMRKIYKSHIGRSAYQL